MLISLENGATKVNGASRFGRTTSAFDTFFLVPQKTLRHRASDIETTRYYALLSCDIGFARISQDQLPHFYDDLYAYQVLS